MRSALHSIDASGRSIWPAFERGLRGSSRNDADPERPAVHLPDLGADFLHTAFAIDLVCVSTRPVRHHVTRLDAAPHGMAASPPTAMTKAARRIHPPFARRSACILGGWGIPNFQITLRLRFIRLRFTDRKRLPTVAPSDNRLLDMHRMVTRP